MIQAFFGGADSLRARETEMDNISNNIANVNTAGYIGRTTTFSDLLHNSMVRPENSAYANELQGSGTKVDAAVADTSAGSYVETDSALDFAPKGEGFFEVKDADGNTYYTREGQFQETIKNGTTYLTDAEGRDVLDAQGNAITVQGGTPQAAPGVFTFSNPEGLTAEGDTLFSSNALSGAAQASTEGVLQGGYESSNVELSSEMVDMIETQRGFQMDARVVTTADSIESYINNLH